MIYRQTLLLAGIAAAVFGMGFALISLPGCGNDPDSQTTPAGTTDTSPKQNGPTAAGNGTAANTTGAATKNKTQPDAEDVPPPTGERADKPLFDGWGKPAVVLVLTGQQRGYLEPCGCTEGQSGGISRRATLVEQLKDKGWPVVGFDLGGAVHRQRRQSLLKYQTLLAGLKDMGYRGIGLGPPELLFGADHLLSLNVVDESNPDADVPLLSANVVLFESPDLGTPVRSRVTTAGGQKIGIVSVIGKSLADKALPDGPPSDIQLLDAAESLAPIVDELKQQQTSLNVLLAYADTAESADLAKQFPAFDVVVSAGGPEDPARKPQTVGQSLLLHVGQKGKYVGIVGFYPEAAENRLRFELVELKKQQFDDNLKMVEHMRTYQEQLKSEKLAETELPIEHPSGNEFVGAELCGECHTRAYAIWKKTPHARAFESLKHARKGDPDHGITRIYDAECLACHVTGWHPQEVLRYKTGFVNEEFATNEADKLRSQLLQGQQCESCHGPGSRHVALVEEGSIDESRQSVRVTLEQAEDKTCVQCHDLDNSPHFEFKKYWPRVKHYGTD